MSVFAYSVTDV